jgi:hypothetical protein
MDSTTPSPDRVELVRLRREPLNEAGVVRETLTEKEVSALIEAIQKEQEAEAKKAEASMGSL